MVKEFIMTEEDLNCIMDASRSVRYMMTSNNIPPSSPQQNANAAWEKLGRKMGFDYLTVCPVIGKDSRHFTAEPIASILQGESPTR